MGSILGGTPCSLPPKPSRGGGRVGAGWVCGRGAFVQSWAVLAGLCLRLAPCKDGDYSAGEQQARLPPGLQHKSSSFQLTLSRQPGRQHRELCLNLLGGGKKEKPEGIFKGNCPGCSGMGDARGMQEIQHTTSPWLGAVGGRMGKAHPCHTQGFLWVH